MDTQAVTIQGQTYAWSQVEGLAPEAVLTLKPWIVKCAKRYLNKATALNLDLEDVVQAGTLGALKAAKSYNPDRSAFVTWATPRIKKEMALLCKAQPHLSIDAWAEDNVTHEPSDTCDATGDTVAVEVVQILARLSQQDQTVLGDYYGLKTQKLKPHGGFTSAAVSRSTVCQRVNRALSRARKELLLCQSN